MGLDPDIWGTTEDRRRAAESVAVFIKAIAKMIVGADTSVEDRRLAELAAEAREDEQ